MHPFFVERKENMMEKKKYRQSAESSSFYVKCSAAVTSGGIEAVFAPTLDNRTVPQASCSVDVRANMRNTQRNESCIKRSKQSTACQGNDIESPNIPTHQNILFLIVSPCESPNKKEGVAK
jgi:hypothetical protein